MEALNKVLRYVLAGALAALGTSVLIWLLSVLRIFALLNVPVDASGVGLGWFLWRMVLGALWGLLFMVPVVPSWAQWKRGLIFGWGPTLQLWLWDYPHEGRGMFGLESGLLLTISAAVAWLLWGALAGWWLDYQAAEEAEEQDPLGERRQPPSE